MRPESGAKEGGGPGGGGHVPECKSHGSCMPLGCQGLLGYRQARAAFPLVTWHCSPCIPVPRAPAPPRPALAAGTKGLVTGLAQRSAAVTSSNRATSPFTYTGAGAVRLDGRARGCWGPERGGGDGGGRRGEVAAGITFIPCAHHAVALCLYSHPPPPALRRGPLQLSASGATTNGIYIPGTEATVRESDNTGDNTVIDPSQNWWAPGPPPSPPPSPLPGGVTRFRGQCGGARGAQAA